MAGAHTVAQAAGAQPTAAQAEGEQADGAQLSQLPPRRSARLKAICVKVERGCGAG
jgi:hypothetical protein